MSVTPAKKYKGTTAIGFVSHRDQEVISATALRGTDHNARVYELKCRRCGHHYGANGTDIHDRKCPQCQSGRPGLQLEPILTTQPNASRWSVADAKARFSEVVETAQDKGAQIVTKNGRDVAVIVGIKDWTARTARKGSLAEFLLASPLRGSGIDLERIRDKPRDIDL